MTASRFSLFPLLAAALVALTAATLVREVSADRRPEQVDALLESPRLPASVVRLISLGFESALADLSYLQAIQLFGEKRFDRSHELRVVRSNAVARLLDHTTDLDPRFDYAYIFGAYTIPVPDEGYRTHNIDPTIELLRKGVNNGSDDWRIPFNLAYQHSLLGEFTQAAEAMSEAARRPGRPEYLLFLATRMSAQGDSLETGIAMAQAMLDASATEEQRVELDARIRLLVMEKHLRALEAAIDGYRTANGRWPASLEALVAAGALDAIPPEPHEGQWVFDPATGEAHSDAAERLRMSRRFMYEFRAARGEDVGPPPLPERFLQPAPKETSSTP